MLHLKGEIWYFIQKLNSSLWSEPVFMCTESITSFKTCLKSHCGSWLDILLPFTAFFTNSHFNPLLISFGPLSRFWDTYFIISWIKKLYLPLEALTIAPLSLLVFASTASQSYDLFSFPSSELKLACYFPVSLFGYVVVSNGNLVSGLLCKLISTPLAGNWRTSLELDRKWRLQR